MGHPSHQGFSDTVLRWINIAGEVMGRETALSPRSRSWGICSVCDSFLVKLFCSFGVHVSSIGIMWMG